MADQSRIIHRSNADPFDTVELHKETNRTQTARPTVVMRVIGASCGAFVFCFAAILLSLPMLLKIGQVAASVIWLIGLVLGAVGGALFPRLGHFLAYAFVIFVNFMVSLTIGRNLQEQVSLFGIFTFVEIIFFMSHCLAKGKPA